MKTLIKNARIVTCNQVLEGCHCSFADGVIDYIGKEMQSADVVIDATGKYLAPGFIDLHCHGCKGLAFMGGSVEDFEEIARFHLSHGTTTMLATTSSSSMEEIEQALDTFAEYKKKHPHSSLEAMHMEGPWVNPLQCGAQAKDHMRSPDEQDVCTLLQRYPFIRRMDAAPELQNGMAFGNAGREHGIRIGIAHSDAVFSEVEEACQNGYSIMTHLYSGMKGTERKNAYRVAGAVEAGLYFDELYVEVIADGRHLPLELLRYIYKCKGADRICLVTDATRACGLPEGAMTTGVSSMAKTPIIVEDGVAKLMDRQAFAGSCATTDRLYRTMARAIGKDMVALSKMSSLTPARFMGWEDRGEIAVGKRADMVILNEELEIEKVITDNWN